MLRSKTPNLRLIAPELIVHVQMEALQGSHEIVGAQILVMCVQRLRRAARVPERARPPLAGPFSPAGLNRLPDWT